MPSINSQVQKNAERIAQGGDLVQAAGPSNNAANPTPMPPPPPVTGLPVRGYYPQGMTLDQDFGGTSQITRTGPNMRSPTFPKQPGIVSTIISKAAAAISSTAASLIIKVNNMLAPNQSVLNFLQGTGMTITVDASGNLLFVSTATGDGLTHSAAPWESDPAYVILRDDFSNIQASSNTANPVQGIGNLGWNLYGLGGTAEAAHAGLYGGAFPNLGQFWWDSNGTIRQFSWLNLPQNGTTGSATGTNMGWPLFESPGWQMTWVFRLGGSTATITSSQTGAFGQKSMYVGLAGNTAPNQYSSSLDLRPDVFFGVRYDTSGYPGSGGAGAPGIVNYAATAVTQSGSSMALTGTFTGANQITGTTWVGLWFTVTGAGNAGNNGVFVCTAATSTTLTLLNPNGVNATVQTITCKSATPMILTAAANGNGTQVVYTGSIYSPVSNNFVGQLFYVSGFGNAGNNGGPWLCTANNTTTITLANTVATGQAETHAGYVGGPRIGDTQLVLEAVQNPSYFNTNGPNFTQGTTLSTGVIPTLGAETWHRLDIVCKTAGSITLTLDGTTSLTAAVSKPTITVSGSGLTGSVGNQQLLMSWTATSGTIPSAPWATGSSIAITGFSGTQAGFNGTFPLLTNRSSGGGTLNFDYPAAFTVASASVSGTLSGYPAVFPFAGFGNDNSPSPTTSTATFWVDFFSFVWNPNLGPSAPGTPNSSLSRYW